MSYNLRTKARREELLEQESNPESEYEEQSGSESEQNESDTDDVSYCDDEISEEDMEDEVQNARAKQARMSLSDENNSSRAPQRGRPVTKLYGKNGFVWKTQFAERRSDRMSDVQAEFGAELVGETLNLQKIENFWDLLFTNEMIDLIVERTNLKIERECAEMVAEDKFESYHHHTDAVEMRAFIGVLYYAGLWKAAHVDVNELWERRNGLDFYRCVFTHHRFTFLQFCLRFDVLKERDPEDRFSPIREIWDIFIENCGKYYRPSSKCTVDEQLLSFRGRCIFRMYMKAKPDKYGLKILTLNDASTAYLVFAILYLGQNAKISNPQKLPISEYFFQEVTAPIHGTDRTVTCDNCTCDMYNWFSSIPLLQRMLAPPFKLSITGTIKKNKQEVPLELKIASPNPPATKFCEGYYLTFLHSQKKENCVSRFNVHEHQGNRK
ncbi:PREDICTED: piggyBac transposable element-derived protein 4-like [Wasmannia auropunctata]|uniref:piggyBac transposable element-derived protein 4-like n=1 Tax=Wasmannia auropunctata TaxID=64793 RepID=UPI0005F02983|nr:PREDICTED: piggyBac transposable element-derived protein 4-like [Wasmannia auropunctata]